VQGLNKGALPAYFVLDGTRQTSVRPHRYAFEQAAGIGLTPDTVLRHVCNITICVRPEPEHLIVGSQRENMPDRAFDGRHANGTTWRWRGIGRKAFADRSRALRNAALKHGWNPAILAPLMSGTDPEAPTLF
jgi:hypothetical protein